MDTHQRILIVGAGIFGLSIAEALGRRGHAHVEVVDRGRAGEGTTSLAAGVLSLHTWNDVDAAFIHRTRALAEELAAWGAREGEAAARTAWRRTGGLTVAGAPHHATLEAMHARLHRLGEPADLLSGREASPRFDAFRFKPDETVLWSPGEGVIESTDLVQLLRRRMRSFGIRLREEVPVDSIRFDHGRVSVVRFSDGRSERADHVVVAAGAWSRTLLARSGIPLPALPYRTQLATLELAQSGDLPVLHDTVHGFYARPESSQRFLAGDGTELREFDPDRFDRAADAAFVESLAQRVPARFRRGNEVAFRKGWAGLCVGTPDRRPLAGPFDAWPGLHVLTGDNGFGLMRGLALGEFVASLLGGGAPESARELNPQRFGPHPPETFELREGFSLPD